MAFLAIRRVMATHACAFVRCRAMVSDDVACGKTKYYSDRFNGYLFWERWIDRRYAAVTRPFSAMGAAALVTTAKNFLCLLSEIPGHRQGGAHDGQKLDHLARRRGGHVL